MSEDDDFPEDMQGELAAARAAQQRRQSADAVALAGMRAAVARIEHVAQQPVEAPEAQASERVEHAAGVALPHSITIGKLPKVQLEPQIDPRRMMTQPSIRAVEGPAGLGPAPRAVATAGNTVGGNTGRFPDAGDATPPSSDAVDSHELPVPVAPTRRRWLSPAILASAVAVGIAVLTLRGGTAPDRAHASTKAVSEVARTVAAASPSAEPVATAVAPSTASASAEPAPAPPPSAAPSAAPIETASPAPSSNPPAAPAAPTPAKRLPFEPD